jgi:hypothetical protein
LLLAALGMSVVLLPEQPSSWDRLREVQREAPTLWGLAKPPVPSFKDYPFAVTCGSLPSWAERSEKRQRANAQHRALFDAMRQGQLAPDFETLGLRFTLRLEAEQREFLELLACHTAARAILGRSPTDTERLEALARSVRLATILRDSRFQQLPREEREKVMGDLRQWIVADPVFQQLPPEEQRNAMAALRQRAGLGSAPPDDVTAEGPRVPGLADTWDRQQQRRLAWAIWRWRAQWVGGPLASIFLGAGGAVVCLRGLLRAFQERR